MLGLIVMLRPVSNKTFYRFNATFVEIFTVLTIDAQTTTNAVQEVTSTIIILSFALFAKPVSPWKEQEDTKHRPHPKLSGTNM